MQGAQASSSASRAHTLPARSESSVSCRRLGVRLESRACDGDLAVDVVRVALLRSIVAACGRRNDHGATGMESSLLWSDLILSLMLCRIDSLRVYATAFRTSLERGQRIVTNKTRGSRAMQGLKSSCFKDRLSLWSCN